MKKQVFYGIIGGVVLIEILFVLFFLLPNMSESSALSDEVEEEMRKLSCFIERQPDKFPTQEAVKRHQDNAKAIKDGYIACLRYLSGCDESLERYFPGLGAQPALAAFGARYLDEMKNLRKLCNDRGILIASKETRLTEQTRKLLSEEVERVGGAAVPPHLTTPKEEWGLWEAAQITGDNMNTAQKEFWVQEAIVNALIEANATQLTLISFPYSAEKEREKQKETKKKTEMERLFKTSEVVVAAEMPYKGVNRFINALMDTTRHRLLFVLLKLRIEKKELTELTVPDPIATKRWSEEVSSLLKGKKLTLDANDLKGVLPNIIVKMDTPLDVGRVEQDKVQEGRLPIKQEFLITEPPVIVLVRLRLYDFTPDKATEELLKSK